MIATSHFPFFSSFSKQSLPNRSNRNGFNLLEMLAVLAVIGLLAVMGLPTFFRVLERERIEGFLRTATLSVERAKGEGAKQNVPVIVRADFAQNALYAFADLDRDGQQGSDESELFTLLLPSLGSQREQTLLFWAAGEAEPEGSGAVIGFSADPTPGEHPNQAILDPDGSARDAGAFRFGLAGDPGNFYEVRIEPAATARVQLRKYLLSSPPAFMARNPNQSASWPWY